MEYMGKKIWEDTPASGDMHRQNYIDGISAYIQRMNQTCKQTRRDWMPPEKLAENLEAYRQKYKDMIGLSLFAENPQKAPLQQLVGEDEVGKIYRLTIWITEEIPFYAMLIMPHEAAEPMPLVVAQHGGYGTPELCSDFLGKNNYNHMVQRVLARGAAVLAPQIAVWTKEETETARAHPIAYDRLEMDVAMKRFGSSLTALEMSGIMKAIDYAATLPQIDGQKIGMLGISYGGYFTLNTMAADTRIKAGYCVAVFNDRDVYSLTGWCYNSSAKMFQDAEVAALCAPRKLFVQIGKEDNVFRYESALPEVDRVYDYFKAFGKPDNFGFSLWDGGHTMSDSDCGLDFLFDALNNQ